jgi:hypothetical protein
MYQKHFVWEDFTRGKTYITQIIRTFKPGAIMYISFNAFTFVLIASGCNYIIGLLALGYSPTMSFLVREVRPGSDLGSDPSLSNTGRMHQLSAAGSGCSRQHQPHSLEIAPTHHSLFYVFVFHTLLLTLLIKFTTALIYNSLLTQLIVLYPSCLFSFFTLVLLLFYLPNVLNMIRFAGTKSRSPFSRPRIIQQMLVG